VQTIAGPGFAKLMLVRTNSVSGQDLHLPRPGTGHRETGALMPPVFAHGALRLYLLALLEAGPKHGYELIKALSERFGGTYSPSAGTIYPRLGKLEEEGLVPTDIPRAPHQLQHHRRQASLELNSRRDELGDRGRTTSAASVRRLADNLRADIRSQYARAACGPGGNGGSRTAPPAQPAQRSTRWRARAATTADERQHRLKEAEMLLQAFRDDMRTELRLRTSGQPMTPVALETVQDCAGPGPGLDPQLTVGAVPVSPPYLHPRTCPRFAACPLMWETGGQLF
jgi:hypothetical protein